MDEFRAVKGTEKAYSRVQVIVSTRKAHRWLKYEKPYGGTEYRIPLVIP